MPHVYCLWPGKSEQQKQRLAEGVTKAVMTSAAVKMPCWSALRKSSRVSGPRRSTLPTSLMGPASSTRGPITSRSEVTRSF
jgi:hypothetical protein